MRNGEPRVDSNLLLFLTGRTRFSLGEKAEGEFRLLPLEKGSPGPANSSLFSESYL